MPGPNEFPSCDFEADDCGWKSTEVEGSNYLWELISPKECVELGLSCPDADPNSDAEGIILNLYSLKFLVCCLCRSYDVC